MSEEAKIVGRNDAAAVPAIDAGPSAPKSKDASKKEESDFPFAVAVGNVYEGPLDLLLDLIRKQDIDIYDIPIAKITAQYLTYVEKIRELDVNVAAEFIYMSAVQMLLQKQQIEDAVLTNPSLKEFMDAEGTEPEIAADVIDLVKTFQQVLERVRTRPVINVDEETVTVGQMIDYLRRRLSLEDRPIRLKQLLMRVP